MSAFTDLMNRAIDKPAEHVQVAGSDGGPFVIRWQRDNDDNEQVLQRSGEMDDEIAGI